MSSHFSRVQDFGVLRVVGEDANEFLQAQTTTDVASIEQLGYGAVCNLKGRVMAVFAMLRAEDGWRLVMPTGVIEPLARRLSMYKLRSRVEIEDETAHVEVVGVTGVIGVEGGHRVGDGQLFVESKETDLGARLIEAGAREEPHAWIRKQIERGIGWVFAHASEKFLPQMLDLESIGAISFTKGCFPGQEVVARLQHLGQAKRQLYKARTKADVDLSDRLVIRDGDRVKAVGDPLYAAKHDDGSDLLAVIETSAVDQAISFEKTGDPVTVESASE